MKKALFIDRDGTLIVEPPVTEQVDNLEQMEFLRHVISSLRFIRQHTDYELVMVTNQDGLGTEAYPQAHFDSVQGKMLQVLESEDVRFDDILIDKSYASEGLPTRKPGTGLLGKYMTGEYDLSSSYVIGDRDTDMQLAENLGCKGLLLSEEATTRKNCRAVADWDKVTEIVYAGERVEEIHRKTRETDVYVRVDLDGTGKTEISTGVGFFDHMLDQLGKHSGMDLTVKTVGDLEVDTHHTIEDTALALGEVLGRALGNKRGIMRFGYCLPMDDSLSRVAIDFCGRPWLIYDVKFRHDMLGQIPTEMFFHFFKSFSDTAKINLNIWAEGDNDHHIIEGVFKAVAKSIQMAIRRNIENFQLPSTKGVL